MCIGMIPPYCDAPYQNNEARQLAKGAVDEMNVKDLVCFVAAVDSGSSVAATRLAKTSQSNISRRIRSLERELRVSLFTRIRYGLVPTPSARKLYPLAQKVLATVRKIEQDFSKTRPRSRR